MPVHVRTGDTVMVTAGNDKGAVGEILTVLTKNCLLYTSDAADE